MRSTSILFSEDDAGVGKTEGDGTFLISYSPTPTVPGRLIEIPTSSRKYSARPTRSETLRHAPPLHETPEAEDVTDSNHEVGTITIHRNNLDGWLVTHTTLLHPASGDPVAFFHHNRVTPLIDGATMFPTGDRRRRLGHRSINLADALFGGVNNGFTKFKPSFDPLNPRPTVANRRPRPRWKTS